MPGLSRFSRKQPSTTAASTNGGEDGKTAATNGGGGAPAKADSGHPSKSDNAGHANGGVGDNATNFSSSLDRPSTGGSNVFADFGNMFTMNEHTGVDSASMLDSTFLSSTPTEGGTGDGAAALNNAMIGDNSFMQGFGSRPSTGEGDVFQFGGMGGFGSEGVDSAAEQPTTANGDNEANSTDAKRPAEARDGGGGVGIGIGLFAKRRAVPAASKAVTSNVSGQPENVLTNQHPPKNDGLASAASSVANLSQFDTNLLSESENKTENEASSSGNVQIPKSIATSGGDVEDDLTVGTTTSVAAVAMTGGVANALPPAPAGKSPYFSSVAKPGDTHQASNATSESSSPSKEEIIIPGMNVGTEKSDADVTAEAMKQDVTTARNASSSQRVSLSPPGATNNQASSKGDDNSIVIPGVTTNDDMNVAQSMLQLGGTVQGRNSTSAATATNTQRVSGSFTSSSALNNNSRGIGRFNTTEKVKFVLPESATTTKAADMKSTASMSMANTTAITPDHRKGAKQGYPASTSNGSNQQNAVTPTPHKPDQFDSASSDRVVPGMMSGSGEKHDNASNETMVDVDIQELNNTTGGSVQSPTPVTKNDAPTPKASNLNTGYSGSSILATHESFDELLSQLGADLTEATDIHNKGNLDLLHLEVSLTHAYAKALQLKGQYVDLIDEIDAVASMGDSILIELEG